MKPNKVLPILPILGILLYIGLFFLAKVQYDSGTEEYSMDQQLLCDMMAKESKSGLINKARSLAVLGHIFLFIGMSIFFYVLPKSFKNLKSNTPLFQISGISSMVLFLLIATDYHDLFVLIAGSIAVFTGILLIYQYLKDAINFTSIMGIISMMLSIMVFASYQFQIRLDLLPVFQKFVFAFDAAWVFLVCFSVLNKQSQNDITLRSANL